MSMTSEQAQADSLQPFAPGDVFVGATLLNNPDDDHAGRGRILQFDADLNPRGVLWTEGTTHLVYGLTFSPSGELWAFDPWAWLSLRVSPDGHQMANRCFAERAFSLVHFETEDRLWFTESLGGNHQPEPLTTRHRPLPGHDTLLGEGGVYCYTAAGELLQTWYPEYHGGMSGSMAITHSVLAPDGERLIYVSETGPRLMQFNLASGEQLPDLQSFPEGQRQMFFDLVLRDQNSLLVCRGDRLEILSLTGEVLQVWPLEGFGWSVVGSATAETAYVANWFTGEVVRMALGSGLVDASVMIAPKCIAGLAQYSGD